MEGEPLKEKTYNHVAFHVAPEEFSDYVRRVKSFGLEIRRGRKRINGEEESIYFYDYDNHLFEIHTGTLEKRLKAYSDVMLQAASENCNKF